LGVQQEDALVISEREVVRAMLAQAIAEARARGAQRITELHLELYDPSPTTERSLRNLVAELGQNTLAEGAQVVTFSAPSRFICWNCCGLRFESEDSEAICPNCGHEGMLIPVEVTFALEHIEIAALAD
jgi:Zn finger protein HypA/HybF involved in hydrogenase expression